MSAKDRRSKSMFNFEDSQSAKGTNEVGISDLPCFDLSTIAAATDNFSDANKLGEGGFGSVYKVPRPSPGLSNNSLTS